jgi:O-antigen/teichoic acid export membrane protein
MNQPSPSGNLHLLKGTVSIFLAQMLIFPTGFISAIYLARTLGPTGYGLFALVSMMILWVEWLSDAVFQDTTLKFVGEASDWRPLGSLALRVHFIVGGLATALLWVLASPLAVIMNEPAVADSLKLYAIDLPISCMASGNRNILVGRQLFNQRAWVTAARHIARLVLIIVFVEMGLSVKGAILGMIGASTIELIISQLFAQTPFFLKPSVPHRELLGFATPLFLSATLLRIFRLELILLKALGATAAQAGFYGAAQNLSIAPTLFSSSLSSTLLSTLSRLHAGGDKQRIKEIGQTAIRSTFWLLPFAAMTAGASSEITTFVFGERFAPTGTILECLIFASIGLYTIHISKAILTSLDRPLWILKLTAPMVPLALMGHLVLIPRLGALGAAVVTALVACIGGAVSLISVYRLTRLHAPFKTMMAGSVGSILAFVLAQWWPASGLLVIGKIFVIILMIFLLFITMREFTPHEVAAVRKMLYLRFRRK